MWVLLSNLPMFAVEMLCVMKRGVLSKQIGSPKTSVKMKTSINNFRRTGLLKIVLSGKRCK